MSTTKRRFAPLCVWAMVGLAALLEPGSARAHCDGLDGPVVGAAAEAIRKGDVKLALVWVRKQDEAQIKSAFDQTLAVRKLGPDAQKLADTHFYETLVRIHRAGEGAPYTGLKPAGRDLGPAIPSADKAVETADVEPVVDLLVKATAEGTRARFKRLLAAKKYDKGNVEAGRRFIAEYVAFIHYVEELHGAATRPVQGHYPESPEQHGRAPAPGPHHEHK